MGLFDFLGSAVSGGLGLLGQYLNVGYQKELQEHAGATNYKYAEKSARNQPTWNRAGLESAGYNPMLAVQNATSGANSGWTSTGQANPVDLAGDVSTGIANAQSFQRLKNETDQTDSNIKLNEANARNATQDAISKEIHNKYLDNREQKELGQIGAETDKLIRETSYYNQLAENMEAQRRLQEMGINFDYRARIYGANQSYNASTYSANKSYLASRYASDVDAETKRGTISIKNPFGLGGTTRYLQPDDISRMPHRGYRSFEDWDNKKYWHYY